MMYKMQNYINIEHEILEQHLNICKSCILTRLM